MLYEVIIQYWVWEGQGWIWIYGRPTGSTNLTGWYFRAEGIEWQWWVGVQARREAAGENVVEGAG